MLPYSLQVCWSRPRDARTTRAFASVLSSVLIAALATGYWLAWASAADPGPGSRAGLPHGPATARVSACFVPEEPCVDDIVSAIAGARQEIRVQAYGFTSPPILRALAAAKVRGVDVQVILDKSNDRAGQDTRFPAHLDNPDAALRLRSRYSGATYMANAGVPVWIDDATGIAHNKLIVIDRRLVIGGSYNYTLSAERRNAENVTFIDSAEVAEWFRANWLSGREASRPFRAE